MRDSDLMQKLSALETARKRAQNRSPRTARNGLFVIGFIVALALLGRASGVYDKPTPHLQTETDPVQVAKAERARKAAWIMRPYNYEETLCAFNSKAALADFRKKYGVEPPAYAAIDAVTRCENDQKTGYGQIAALRSAKRDGAKLIGYAIQCAAVGEPYYGVVDWARGAGCIKRVAGEKR